MFPRSATSLALVALAAGVAPLPAQSAPLGAALSARIDSVFGRFTAPGSPGCALGVVRDGSLVHARGYGLASVEHGVPITSATVFDIGSVSKQFTAMSVVLLAQEGKLSLDDEIQRFLPEVPRYGRPVTIRHLLHHTSGLRDYIDVLGWSGISDEAVTTDQDALDAIVRQKATNFTPGAEFLYSNSGFFLLSVIVKRAGGQSLREFARVRIFEPLGMSHTQFVDRHDMIVPGKAGSYADGAEGGFTLALANWEQTGDGAVNTTVDDLVKWDRNFSTGTVGGAAARKTLETAGVLNDGKPITYALGMNVDSYRGVSRVSHGGAWAGFRAFLLRFPANRVSVITLCNLASGNPSELSRRVGDLLLGDLLASAEPTFTPRPQADPPKAPSRNTLASVAGVYHSDELLADWRVFLRGDTLVARPGLGAEVLLRPSGPDSFSASGTRVSVLKEGSRVTGIALTSRGLRNFKLTRIGNVP